MEMKKEMLIITYTRYIHFKNQKETNEFAKTLMDNDHYFAIQKNSIWIRVNENIDKSLEEENEIKELLADFTKNRN